MIARLPRFCWGVKKIDNILGRRVPLVRGWLGTISASTETVKDIGLQTHLVTGQTGLCPAV